AARVVELGDDVPGPGAQRAAPQPGEHREVGARVARPQAVVARLDGATGVLLDVAALEDPRPAQWRQALPDVGGRVGVGVRAARVIDAHGRVGLRAEAARRGRERDLSHGDSHVGPVAGDVDLPACGERLDAWFEGLGHRMPPALLPRGARGRPGRGRRAASRRGRRAAWRARAGHTGPVVGRIPYARLPLRGPGATPRGLPRSGSRGWWA